MLQRRCRQRHHGVQQCSELIKLRQLRKLVSVGLCKRLVKFFERHGRHFRVHGIVERHAHVRQL